MKTNFSWEQLEAALEAVNLIYAGNVKLIRGTERPAWRRFTPRVNDSKGPGAKLFITWSHTRRSVAACWHVHGDFFDALWNLPHARTMAYYIESGRAGRMRGPCDNWQDFNIGAPIAPLLYSQSCECGPELRDLARACAILDRV